MLSSLQVHCPILWAREPHDSETTKFQWARRAQSSYPPGLLRCDGPKRRRRLAASLLGIVCRRPVSFVADRGFWDIPIPSASTTMRFFLGGAGLVRQPEDPEVDPTDAVSNRLGAWFSKLLGLSVRAGCSVLGRYEPVGRLIDVDELSDCDEDVQSVDRMHAKWRVSNSADEKKRFVLCPSPQTHSEPKSIGKVHRSVRGQR